MSQLFLGIPFWNGNTADLLKSADQDGGLFTVPSAPSLAQMRHDPDLKRAYQASDLSVVDGGYVALILRLVFGRRFPRISGLQILQWLVGIGHQRAIAFHERKVLWVVPTDVERERIKSYLDKSEDPIRQNCWYTAPFYQEPEDFDDEALRDLVSKFDPDWVVLCIGGGRQEKLGLYLRRGFQAGRGGSIVAGGRKNGPVILCTGGAISFLSGGQAAIPTWADRSYLGWLMRIFQSPKQFLPRYWTALYDFPRLLWAERNALFSEKTPI